MKHTCLLPLATVLTLLSSSFGMTSAAGAEDARSASVQLPHCKRFLARSQDQPVQGRSDLVAEGTCVGKIIALDDTAGTGLLPQHMRFCYPSGVNIGQMVQVVVRYLETHPARLHENFTLVAWVAMRDAWPCP